MTTTEKAQSEEWIHLELPGGHIGTRVQIHVLNIISLRFDVLIIV